MKVISYNIQYGRGMDGNIDLVRSCQPIRGADIICLQEVEQQWQRSSHEDQPAVIAGLMPSYYYVYGSSFDVDASSHAAHGAVVNRRRRHGNMILSRWPILSCRTFNLPKLHYEDKFNMHMGFVEGVIDTGSICLRIYSYHAGYLESVERLAQVEEFASVFNRSAVEKGAWSGKPDINGDDWSNKCALPEMPVSALVCGDFNSNPESEEYRLLLNSTGLIDCWALTDPVNQNTPTTKKGQSEDIKMWGKIDHVFVTPDLSGHVTTAGIDHDTDASDHKPITVELELT